MRKNLLLGVGALLLVVLLATNPSVEDYRGHIREREGLVGSLGLLAADVLSSGDGKSTGIHRDNYWVCSRYYLGGDGLLPRQDLAWGALGAFWLEERSRR
jgi:hypothetical protein